MPAFKDITGQYFGRWTIIKRMPPLYRGSKMAFWRCRCSCGNEGIVSGVSLRAGVSNSCGCFRREKLSQRMTTHGMGRHRLYKTWTSMHQRCSNPKAPRYPDYGGRGIRVCKRWATFIAFYTDMGDRPSPQHTLDRIDNDKGYNKANCRWATRTEQKNNKRKYLRKHGRLITAFGKTLHLADWARMVGIHKSTLYSRLKYGWPPERALTP